MSASKHSTTAEKTSVGLYPKDWEVQRLSSLTKLIIDGTHFTPNYLESGVPFLRVTDIGKRGLKIENFKFISIGEHRTLSKRCKPEIDDILYSKNGTIGLTKIVDWSWEFSIFVSLALLKVRKDMMCPSFLQAVLDSDLVSTQIRFRSKQGTVANLHLEEIREFEIPVPEIREQTKIAEILSTVDRAIEQTETLITKQQRLKTGLMQDLLTRGIDEHGNLRSEQTHPFKDSPLGRIPVEWEVKRIDELLANVDPSMRSGPFGSALLKEELVESGVPLLGIDNVHTEKFVASFARFVHYKKAETLKRYYVRPRDIMITIMGTVGRCCVVPDDIGTALSSKHTWTISLDQKVYSSYLACLQINHASWVLNHFAKDEQGGIMSSIKSDTLRSTLLPVPPWNELVMIEEKLKSLTDDFEIKADVLKKLRALKTALMQDLLTGRKRVTALLNNPEATA